MLTIQIGGLGFIHPERKCGSVVSILSNDYRSVSAQPRQSTDRSLYIRQQCVHGCKYAGKMTWMNLEMNFRWVLCLKVA